MYTYVVQEYRVSNELLTEDIFVSLTTMHETSILTVQNLQASVQRIEAYVKVLEDKVGEKK
jgi:hypothetical protein